MCDALFFLLSLSFYVMLMLMGGGVKSNNKATFYTDTEKSPFLRGRRSIVPYVSVIFWVQAQTRDMIFQVREHSWRWK